MRLYETVNDHRISPDMYVIARIDGRNFSRLTREVLRVKPFNEIIAKAMWETTKHVMDCGFDTLFGFTQSDEISLLLDHKKLPFGAKIRKFISILASETSVKFSTELRNSSFQTQFPSKDLTGIFDCRLIQIPTIDRVVDYFSWRVSDSVRNCLNAWCYYTLTKCMNLSPKVAQGELEIMPWHEKIARLAAWDIVFDNLPLWQKMGVGIYWTKYKKEGFNPMTNEKVLVDRRRLEMNSELPRGEHGEHFKEFIKIFCE